MDTAQIERRLREACLKIQERGWRILPRYTIRPLSNECCPIAATYLTRFKGPLDSRPGTVIRHGTLLAGMDHDEANAFMRGFDGMGKYHVTRLKKFEDMGRRLRKEFVK